MASASRLLNGASFARQALDVVQADLDSLSEGCARITGVLASTRLASADLLDETAKLRRLLEGSLHRSQLVERFLEQYQLSHDEVYALQVRRACYRRAGDRYQHVLQHQEPSFIAKPSLVCFASSH